MKKNRVEIKKKNSLSSKHGLLLIGPFSTVTMYYVICMEV